MRFWDSSALVPLLIPESSTEGLLAIARETTQIVVWWGTWLECVSALARREREARGTVDHRAADDRLVRLAEGWREIGSGDLVREHAARFLRVHPLRTADALQLAAAFVAAELRPASLPLITLDRRLAEAARKEGFPLIEPVLG